MASKRLLSPLARQCRYSKLHSYRYQIRTFCSDGQGRKDGELPGEVLSSDQRTESEMSDRQVDIVSERVGSESALDNMSVQDLLEQSAVQTTEQIEPEFPSDLEDIRSQQNYQKWRRSQEKHSFRPKVDPRETSLFLFPGQGSQFVGMAKKLLPYPNVKEMFDLASEILGYDLLHICLHGPRSDLDSTVFCQPAVFVTSLAAVEKLREDRLQAVERCIGAAGFSIGEYAALVFCGSLSFEDALHLVKLRAEAMQEASNVAASGMMSVFLRPESRLRFACEAARTYCREKLSMPDPVCNVANFLYPECKVIAGNEEALQFIEEFRKEFGLARLKRLPVSGAFHTPLMYEAAKQLKVALKKVEFQRPLIPVYSNVTSHKYRNATHFANLLTEQVFKPVKWEQIMHVMYSRKQGEMFPDTFELGPGRQLGTLLRMVNSKAYAQYHQVDV